MKISLTILFLVLVTVIQFGTSNVLSKGDTQEEDVLLSDENGIQNGSDVIMVNPGPLDVILTNGNELAFEICSMKCTTDFLVCYEADSAGQNVLEQCDSKCGFYITTLGDEIAFMDSISLNSMIKTDKCFDIMMKNGENDVSVALNKIHTCSPKIENGIVKLNIVNANSECPVSIKNALIKPDPTTAAPTTLRQFAETSKTRGNGSATTDDESGSFIDKFWWIFLVLGILIVVVIVGIVVYCCIRRRRSKKAKKTIAPPRKLRESKSPVVLQPSTETQHRTNESAVKPNSLYQQSSILSHKSLMWSKKEENKSAEETDLTSMKPTA